MSSSLSLPQDMWQSLYGIGQNSAKTTYCSKPLRYSIGFVESHSDGIETIFSMFYNYFKFGCLGFLFTERFSLRYAISNLSLITYQKLPPLLKFVPTFVGWCQHMLPWSTALCTRLATLIDLCWLPLQLSEDSL